MWARILLEVPQPEPVCSKSPYGGSVEEAPLVIISINVIPRPPLPPSPAGSRIVVVSRIFLHRRTWGMMSDDE